MKLRGLLGTALLLAIPAMAQPVRFRPPASHRRPSNRWPVRAQSLPRQLPQFSPRTYSVSLPPLQVDCTPASQASELTGKHGCVAGRVFRITTTKHGDTHLSLCPSRRPRRRQLLVSRDCQGARHGSVGDLAYLHGRIIAVVGDVNDYRGHPAIIVRDKEQLQVAADEAPPEFDAGQRRPGGRGIPGARSVPGVRAIPGVGNGRAW